MYRNMHARILRVALAAAVLCVSLVATPAFAARATRIGSQPKTISATVTPTGAESATIRINRGQPPFSVSMLTASGPRLLYRGTRRTVRVPLVAGENRFLVSGASKTRRTTRTASASRSISIRPLDISAESTVVTGIGSARFWVADNVHRKVHRFDAAVDTVTVTVPLPGDDVTSTVRMRNIAVRPSDDHVFVVFSDETAAQTRNRIVELDANGSRVATITVPGSYKIQDVTFDSADNIYVSDRGTGYLQANRVRITKFSPAGAQLDTTQTVLPTAYFGYPLVNLTTLLEYNAGTDRLVARINTATFAIIDPATLAIESYRWGGDSAITCMTLNTNNASDITLYTGGSGFYAPSFFGKQGAFLSDAKYAVSTIYKTASHDWIVEPTLPAMLDVAVDSNDYVYTVQHDGANGITRAYVVDPAGAAVKTIDLPGGQRISVVR